MQMPFAVKGSQRWLQVAVAKAPSLLSDALRRSGAIAAGEEVAWRSPLSADAYVEYRDSAALRQIDDGALPNRSLSEFWPPRGPVWDALAVTTKGNRLLVEAKAHIAEAASPASAASEESLTRICASLVEARNFYAPRATADWSRSLYQYGNRLAFHYLLSVLNEVPSRLIFLYFCNANDVRPATEAQWEGATALIHALLGLPPDLRNRGVFHAYVDVRSLEDVI
jgi:hypothetical protein